jgi:hypothetical protein
VAHPTQQIAKPKIHPCLIAQLYLTFSYPQSTTRLS